MGSAIPGTNPLDALIGETAARLTNHSVTRASYFERAGLPTWWLSLSPSSSRITARPLYPYLPRRSPDSNGHQSMKATIDSGDHRHQSIAALMAKQSRD
jgi:hypothetical protein